MLIKRLKQFVAAYWSSTCFKATSSEARPAPACSFAASAGMSESYDKVSLAAHAQRNQQLHLPAEIRIHRKADEKVTVIYDTMPIYKSTDSSNAGCHRNNVVPLPSLMDAKTTTLLTQFMQQERQQPFVKAHNDSLKFYLREVKAVRNALKRCRASLGEMVADAATPSNQYQAIESDFAMHQKVLRALLAQFQTDKTRLQAKREVYKPILRLVLKYHSRRKTAFTQEICTFIHKQQVFLDKLTGCYDKLMIAVSGLLSRAEVHLHALRTVTLPSEEAGSQAAEVVLGYDADTVECGEVDTFNLIELSHYVALDAH